jgi:uncharacterized protein
MTCVLPIANNRQGKCIGCGKCCRLPHKCAFLKENYKGESYCSIYEIRPLNCRKYPRTESEHITKETCGYSWGKDGRK